LVKPIVMGTKKTKHPNHMNKSRPNSKSRSWYKKIKNKTQCEHNVNAKVFYYKKHDKNITRSWQRYVLKIGVEQTKSNVGFYLYLYPLGT
jgi:hypothetical protein